MSDTQLELNLWRLRSDFFHLEFTNLIKELNAGGMEGYIRMMLIVMKLQLNYFNQEPKKDFQMLL